MNDDIFCLVKFVGIDSAKKDKTDAIVNSVREVFLNNWPETRQWKRFRANMRRWELKT